MYKTIETIIVIFAFWRAWVAPYRRNRKKGLGRLESTWRL